MQSETPEPAVDADAHADAPQPDQASFADLGLDEGVLKALRDVGYETPSPIQAATIPPLLAGRDVVGLAQTGTGKTAAFALPILSPARPQRRRRRRRWCSRRPASSRSRCARRSSATPRTCTACTCCRSTAARATASSCRALRRGVHVVVGTPGRIMDHLEKGTLDLSELRFLVLDEADEMLNMGFAEDVETILADTPEDKQVALFSATMPAADPPDLQEVPAPTRSRSRSRPRPRRRPTSRQRYLQVVATRRSSTRSPASSRSRTSTG